MENIALHAFIIATISGSATMLGAVIAILMRPTDRLLSIALAFSAGAMSAVSLLELLPYAAETAAMYMPTFMGIVALFLACFVGIIFGAILNLLLPEGIGEHHHLFRVGVFSMIAMIFHNIPEGVAVFLSGYSDMALGLSIATAIALHNIPEGIAIAMPVHASNRGAKTALLMAFAASIAEPFGAVAAWLFLAPYLTESMLALLYSFIAGLMLYISSAELFPTAFKKGFRYLAIFSVLVGFSLTALLLKFC